MALLTTYTINLPSNAGTKNNLYGISHLSRPYVIHNSAHPGFCSPAYRILQCHLSQVTSQTIILHTKNATPFAVDYFVSPIPPDGSCPRPGSEPQSKATSQSPFAVFAENIRGLNSTVLLKSSHTPPLYEINYLPLSLPTG